MGNSSGAFTWIAGIFLAGLLGGGVASMYHPLPIWPSILLQAGGVVLLAIGAFIFAWSGAEFRRHETALMPWTPSESLVVDGPYGHSRNPIYLAFVLMYVGVALVLNSWYILVMAAVVAALFDRAQIPREERYLESTFGDRYQAYKSKVRRWI
jgi:protein-S-isoprenylcysteine O-methyltransferase Ste14